MTARPFFARLSPFPLFRARPAVAAALALLFALLALPAGAQSLPNDAGMIRGFEAVVFGAEITGTFSDSSYLKKFAGPVRVRVENPAEIDRKAAVAGFVRQLNRDVDGLDIAMAGRGEAANFVVHVVDRDDYQRVGRQVYHRPFGHTPGNCIVRSSYGRGGITRSDAIVVSDEGDRLFRRCLIEEVLQGLGPLNENTDAPQSVFNDTSRLTSFTPYDRLIVNMLYDERLRPGMSLEEARPLLPAVLKDAKRRLRL